MSNISVLCFYLIMVYSNGVNWYQFTTRFCKTFGIFGGSMSMNIPLYFRRNLVHKLKSSFNITRDIYAFIRPNMILIPLSHKDVEIKYSFTLKNISQDCVDCYTTCNFHRSNCTCDMMLNNYSLLVTGAYVQTKV